MDAHGEPWNPFTLSILSEVDITVQSFVLCLPFTFFWNLLYAFYFVFADQAFVILDPYRFHIFLFNYWTSGSDVA